MSINLLETIRKPRRYKSNFWLIFVGTQIFTCTLIFFLAGCGYYSPYGLKTGAEGPVKVYAPMWENLTNELGLEAMINNAVHDWLTETKIIRLTDEAADADYILEGTIQSIDLPGLSYGSFEQATEVRADLEISYVFKEKKSGEIIYSIKNFMKRATFSVGTDAPHYRTNKDQALATIANELGEDVQMNIFYALTRKNKRSKEK